MSDFAAANAAYQRAFLGLDATPPTRACVVVRDGPVMDALAYADLTDRRGLHVRSRSYWAPANIGPYAQLAEVRLRACPN